MLEIYIVGQLELVIKMKFSEEQLKNLTAITWLYRGENERYLKLIDDYINEYVSKSMSIDSEIKVLKITLEELLSELIKFRNDIENNYSESEVHKSFCDDIKALENDIKSYQEEKEQLLENINEYDKYINESKVERFQ